jgi:hypothetical protein
MPPGGCGAYGCSGSGCRTSCTQDSDCAFNYHCYGGQCVQCSGWILSCDSQSNWQLTACGTGGGDPGVFCTDILPADCAQAAGCTLGN